VLTSGIYDKTGGTPDSPWSSYYGIDAGRYAALSALPGLVATDVPLLVTWAELDRADFIADGKALVAARKQAGKPVDALEVSGHSHISEIYAIGTADTSLTDPVLHFIDQVSGDMS
jgi:triacylglycerol lipase